MATRLGIPGREAGGDEPGAGADIEDGLIGVDGDRVGERLDDFLVLVGEAHRVPFGGGGLEVCLDVTGVHGWGLAL
jgi:hypothetical protein